MHLLHPSLIGKELQTLGLLKTLLACFSLGLLSAGYPDGSTWTMPYNSGSINTASTLFTLNQAGTGRAGFFFISNASNSNPALEVRTNGSGNALFAYTTGSGYAIYAYTNGSAQVARFVTNNTSNTLPTLHAIMTGLGRAGYFQINNSSNSQSALRGYTNGRGPAGSFEIGNSGSSANALEGKTNGSGAGVAGYSTATAGTTYGVYGQSDSPSGYGGYFLGRGYFSGRVGIGTSDPESHLHVLLGSAGTVTADANSVLTLEHSDRAYLSILTPNNKERGILFGQPSSNVAGGIIYNNSATPNGLQFRTNGNITRMVIDDSGKVGIGTTSPSYALHVQTSAGDRAIFGYSTGSGTTYGVVGRSDSPSGRGVYGFATATSGITVGVYGQSDSSSGWGVFGYAPATSGNTNGVYGQSDSPSGRGVFGYAPATSGNTNGVYGQSDSPSGWGVYGFATATSGFTNGVYGRSDSPNGRGVVGSATATSGNTYGVWGLSNSPDGYGVYGYKPSGGSGYGVYYENGLAGTGTKSFQMDHPLMPETHYLNHFCTEGPEPYNAYSGNVVTDAQGYATVRLPDYFESINRDFRYQLTVIGGAGEEFVQARVVRKIQNNQFVIRTSKPHVEVSWRVEAVRNDLWVQRYGYQTEPEKPKEHQGKYLHPELYGQPEERGIHYHPDRKQAHALEKPR